jgi:hypothetical protein
MSICESLLSLFLLFQPSCCSLRLEFVWRCLCANGWWAHVGQECPLCEETKPICHSRGGISTRGDLDHATMFSPFGKYFSHIKTDPIMTMLAAFNCGLTRPWSAGALHVQHDMTL